MLVRKSILTAVGVMLIAAISSDFAGAEETTNVNKNGAEDVKLPELPLAITSFGADRAGDALYLYGGHHGQAHHYSNAGQSGDLLRLDLKSASKWEKIATGPKLQGLALIARGGKLYRIGGFQARNTEGDEHDLWSVADCQVFNLETGKWEASIDMPTPRSSFDAVLAGDTIYVVGGWAMAGEKEPVWRDDAYALDLSAEHPQWKPIAKPPFERRALCLGTRDGKVYAIGGMRPKGKITTKTAVYDPKTNEWSEGPKLPGEDMEGFGAACCTVDQQLYVSTSGGHLLKLAADAKSWQPNGKTPGGRFFHQMLPLAKHQLGSIAGANMEEGRYKDIQVLKVSDAQ